MAHGSVRSERDSWMDDNTRGLSLAAAADWDEAAEAFAAAADVLARRAPDVSSHDALALILGNLAQACFRAGRTDDALLHARRACALRVALAGEDAMPVARSFMDLAVMLGASGRLDEAQALIQRAIAAVERHVGDDDARLSVMLENAARLALAAGAPANAEPLLLRLHALLDAHGMPTDRADRLLALVGAARVRADAIPAIAATPDVGVYAHASINELDGHAEWDDQPLRDAVAITDVLLRTTPSGVTAIREPMNRDAEILAAFETVVDTPVEPIAQLIEALPTPTIDIAFELADNFGLPAPPDDAPSMELNFTVEHRLGSSDVPAPLLDASTDLMGFALDDTLADALVDVPAHRPTQRGDETTPARIDEPVAALTEALTPLNAPLRQPVRHVEPMTAHGFGPPPAALMTPEARAEPAPPPTPMPPTARDLTRAHDAAQEAQGAQGAQGGEDATDTSSRLAHRGRTPMSDRHANNEGGNRGGLIGAGVAAVVAIGGAVWYFLLR